MSTDKPTQQYINSAKMISSTWALQQFINPTQRMGSRDFKSSVAPASFAIPGIMLSSRSWAVSSTSSKMGVQLALHHQLGPNDGPMLFQIPQTQ